jgi:hypothetical protein
VWLKVIPEKLFSALGGIVMAASSRPQKAKPQRIAMLGFIQITLQSNTD